VSISSQFILFKIYEFNFVFSKMIIEAEKLVYTYIMMNLALSSK
jgi:hypothetical protein